MNALRVTEVNLDAQLNASTQNYADSLRPTNSNIITVDQLEYGVNYFRNRDFIFGQTFAVDVQPRTLSDGITPQPGVIEFAHELGIEQEQLIMPKLDNHTANVLVVDSPSQLQYIAAEGRNVGYDENINTTFIDALIIKESEETRDYVLAVGGADCPTVIGSAILIDGTRVIFGVHAGRKGCLGGIVENTAERLLSIGVVPGTVNIAVGPGGQTLELPLAIIEKEAGANQHPDTLDIWQESIAGEHSSIASKEHMVIYDNQADVIRRAQLAFQDLLAQDGMTIIDANTLTVPGLKSYRATTIAKKVGDIDSEQSKVGRNALFTRFYY